MRTAMLCAAAALIAAAPAVAAPPSPHAVTIRVPHGDLDLASPHDVSVLKRRITAVVSRACRRPGAYASGMATTDHKCRADALEAAFAVVERRRAVQVAAAD